MARNLSDQTETESSIVMAYQGKWLFHVLPALFALCFLLHACSVQRTGLRSCTYDHRIEGVASFSGCLGRDSNGRLYIQPENIASLKFGPHGLSPVWGEGEGWMYVNRQGYAVITGVAAMDNWADHFHEGLVRMKRGNKWGFANREGKEVIPCRFDGALNFKNGVARVCTGCRAECDTPDCEHRHFSGGDWTCINTKGEEVKNCGR